LADSVQALISFYRLNKMLRCVGPVEIILLVEFFTYLENISKGLV